MESARCYLLEYGYSFYRYQGFIVYVVDANICVRTVGYGDLVPTTDAGKIFTIFFILSCVAFMGKTIADIAKYPVLRRNRRSEFHFIKQFSRKLSKEQLVSIFESKFFNIYPRMRRTKDVLYKAEFSLLALHLMNKINTKDLLVVSRLFDSMDALEEGLLTQETMQLEIEAAKTDAQIQEEDRASLQAERASLYGGQGPVARVVRMISGASKAETEGEPLDNPYIRRSNINTTIRSSATLNPGSASSQARDSQTGTYNPPALSGKESGSVNTAPVLTSSPNQRGSLSQNPLLNQPMMSDTIDSMLSDSWKSAPSNPRNSGRASNPNVSVDKL
jgi:hypothetical protein